MEDDDDLDELLDEVEKRFCRKVCAASPARVGPSDAGKYAKDGVGQSKYGYTISAC